VAKYTTFTNKNTAVPKLTAYEIIHSAELVNSFLRKQKCSQRTEVRKQKMNAV